MGKKTEQVKGKAKETAGNVTGDRGLRQKGRDEQAKGSMKQAAHKTKEAIKKQT
jgi:uncharacterized protein YjbJ (UPF0337 family)